SGGLGDVIPDPEQRLFSTVYKPIIAAVNGDCIAGGIELLLGTDIRLAAPLTRFATPEVSWGLIGAGGICARLTRQIPWAVAMEMLLTGRPITAQRAAEVGLVNRVMPAHDLLDAALETAEWVAAQGPVAVRASKESSVRGGI